MLKSMTKKTDNTISPHTICQVQSLEPNNIFNKLEIGQLSYQIETTSRTIVQKTTNDTNAPTFTALFLTRSSFAPLIIMTNNAPTSGKNVMNDNSGKFSKFILLHHHHLIKNPTYNRNQTNHHHERIMIYKTGLNFLIKFANRIVIFFAMPSGPNPLIIF